VNVIDNWVIFLFLFPQSFCTETKVFYPALDVIPIYNVLKNILDVRNTLNFVSSSSCVIHKLFQIKIFPSNIQPQFKTFKITLGVYISQICYFEYF